MRLLLTNDDGINAPGLRSLAETLSKNHDITIVAPAHENSGVSHGISILKPLLTNEIKHYPWKAFSVDGTPADCVKLALDQLMTPGPDYVVSGINAGENTGINVFYSGTVAAAIEARLQGFPALAVSYALHDAQSFGITATFVNHLLEFIADNPLPDDVILNLNIPDRPFSELKGVQITSQGKNRYHDRYIRRTDPKGRAYYWLSGKRNQDLLDLNEDQFAVDEGYISLTPLRVDFNFSWQNNVVLSKLKHVFHKIPLSSVLLHSKEAHECETSKHI